MNIKPILIVAGEPKSVFFEIFFKSLKAKEYKKPLILIGSEKLLKIEMKKFKFKKKINVLNYENIKNYKLDNRSINILNVNYNKKKSLTNKILSSKSYIQKSFEIAFRIIETGITDKLINGPISKKRFLNGKFPGITEFIAKRFHKEKIAMLIYNKDLSICPVTTHLPLKSVAKKINKKIITEKISLINSFYKKKFNIIPKIAILGLNPHCESIDRYNEDEKIIGPCVKSLSKSYNVSGPYSADTIFLKANRKKFNVIVGMYHDQVLAPFKTLYEYDAINITLGLPFTRVSPDHGPNEKMLGKNLSNPLSLLKAINFLDKN